MSEEYFIKQIKLSHIPCIADPNKIRFIAYFENDVSEILPYLNAIVKGGIYNPNGPTLTIKKEGRLITIHPDRIAAGKIIDENDAKEVIEWIKGLINYCYHNKNKIEPSFESREKLTALDIYKLLPGTNCKKCGELICMAFAVKLSNEETNIMRCSELFSGKYTEKREALINILKSAGYKVPSAFVED